MLIYSTFFSDVKQEILYTFAQSNAPKGIKQGIVLRILRMQKG